MEPECYQIEVLHYLNPHLIWVEVHQPLLQPTKSHEEFYFEQIGLYGVLPLETTIDIVGECLKTKKCLDWAHGAVQVIAQVIEEAVELWFSPTYIDRRTSIFDNNIHKYGDIVIKTKEGQIKKLSRILVKTSFAYYDEQQFYNELTSFNLKTKLDTYKTHGVIKVLEKCYIKNKKPKNHWEKSVHKQTSVFQASQNFELALTSNNLERHNNVFKNFFKVDNVKEIIDKKSKDFGLCKDIDEVAVGCGIARHKSDQNTPITVKKLIIKQIINKKVDKNNTDKVVEESHKIHLGTATNKVDVESKSNEVKSPIKNAFSASPMEMQRDTMETQKPLQIEHHNVIVSDKATIDGPYNVKQTSNKGKKKRKKLILPTYDQKTEKLVAYGPPNTDRLKLKFIVMPACEKSEAESEKLIVTKDEFENPLKKEFVDGLDSEVNFQISNIHIENENQNIVNTDNSKRNFEHNVKESGKILKQPKLILSTKQEETKFMSQSLMKKLRLRKKLNDSLLSTCESTRSNTSGREDMTQNEDEPLMNDQDSDTETTLSVIMKKLDLKEEASKTPEQNKEDSKF